MTEEKRFEILLEEIREQGKIFVEGQRILKETLTREMKEIEERLSERISLLELHVKALGRGLDRVEKDVAQLKKDVVEIKGMLISVATKGDLIVIERRIERLEAVVF